MYSFILSLTVGLQVSKQHTGIKKVVRLIMNRLKPSIPIVMLCVANVNQVITSTN